MQALKGTALSDVPRQCASFLPCSQSHVQVCKVPAWFLNICCLCTHCRQIAGACRLNSSGANLLFELQISQERGGPLRYCSGDSSWETAGFAPVCLSVRWCYLWTLGFAFRIACLIQHPLPNECYPILIFVFILKVFSGHLT